MGKPVGLHVRNSVQNKTKQVLMGRIKMAELASMDEKKFAEHIKDIEEQWLFKELCYPDDSRHRIISYTGFHRAGLNRSFYEFREDMITDRSSPDIKNFMESHKDIIPLVKRLGADRFEKYFLYGGEDVLTQVVSDCGLCREEINKVRQFINNFSVMSEFFNPSAIESKPRIRYTKTASIEIKQKTGIHIEYFSPHMARGKYRIDYDRFEKLKMRQAMTAKEMKELESLIRRLEHVNSRKTVLHRVIEKLTVLQKAYFLSGNWQDLVPLAQARIARDIGADCGTVSRVIYGKSIVTPQGEEEIIRDFFLSRTKKVKKLVITDEDIRYLLNCRYGIGVSRRLVTKCRLFSGIPPSTGQRKRAAGIYPNGHRYSPSA